MKLLFFKNRYIIFYVFIISAFVCYTLPSLISDGMVMDGTLYACIARNLSEGIGNFWQLHFSDTFFNVFYEHPPLAIATESLWFKLLGDSIYVERFYSFTTLLVTTLLIILLWKEITNSYKTGWIPLLLYFSVKKVSWAFANNMLENTMGIFICLSALFYLKSLKSFNIIYLILSGLSLALAFFAKGFTSLFIITLPFFYWVFQKKTGFWRMVFNSLFITLILTAVIIIVYYSLSSESKLLFLNYIKQKVFGKLNLQTVGSRFFIIVAVIYHFAPAFIIGLIAILSARFKQIKINPAFPQYKEALTYLALAISGILPIIISLKQSGHYALTTYPFLAIAIGLFIKPYLEFWQDKIEDNALAYKTLKAFSFILLFMIFVLTYLNIGRIGQDKIMIEDCRKIIKEVGEKSTIGLYIVTDQQYYLYAYYNRYGRVNLDKQKYAKYKYVLTEKKYLQDPVFKNYSPLELNTEQYILMQKNLP